MMRTFISALVAVLLSLVAVVLAQAQMSTQPIGGTLTCVEQTSKTESLTEDQALRLCQGASSLAPLACFEEARQHTTLSQEFAIELCRCSQSMSAVECYHRAGVTTTLSEVDRLNMCSPSLQMGLGLLCR